MDRNLITQLLVSCVAMNSGPVGIIQSEPTSEFLGLLKDKLQEEGYEGDTAILELGISHMTMTGRGLDEVVNEIAENIKDALPAPPPVRLDRQPEDPSRLATIRH